MMRRPRLVLAVALLTVGVFGAPAVANQTHYHEVTLDQVLGTSDVLVVRDPPEPRMRKITVVVATTAKPKAPPYEYYETRYLVEEVIKGDKALAGKELWVKPANWGEGLVLHKMYYLEGESESPIYSRYVPRWKNIAPGKQRIVFVQKPPSIGAYQMAVQDGFESIDGRSEIAKLVGAKR